MSQTTSVSDTLSKLTGSSLPSAFQPGDACLLTLGHIHLPFLIQCVHFGHGKVYYEGDVTDQYGSVRLTVESERCARGMDTMLDYAGPATCASPISHLNRAG